MTSQYFSHLTDTEQAEVLLQKGIFLAERIYKNFNIYLYQVDQFYVEVYYNLRFNTTQGMRSFEDGEALDPYLDTIDITAIYH